MSREIELEENQCINCWGCDGDCICDDLVELGLMDENFQPISRFKRLCNTFKTLVGIEEKV